MRLCVSPKVIPANEIIKAMIRQIVKIRLVIIIVDMFYHKDKYYICMNKTTCYESYLWYCKRMY